LQSGQFLTLLLAAGLVVLAVFVARYIMVLLLPLVLPAELRTRIRIWRYVLIWSGLRGALSLALVLALPLNIPDRTELIFSTYAVVFFTLLVQGFSVRYVLHHTPAVES
jgi:CPA1 family monovalent cation:H+ antiporter